MKYQGPVVLVVMDGVGLAPDGPGNAWALARTEFLDYAKSRFLNIPLLASGEAVGILPGDMGNSEVGHNALGSGQIIKQGVAKIEDAFSSEEIFDSRAWKEVVKRISGADSISRRPNSGKRSFAEGGDVEISLPLEETSDSSQPTLHFSGIFSDGNVHSSISHLEALVRRANQEGIKKIRFHLVLDGRDVPPQSEPKYINRLENFIAQFNDQGADYKIASGCGRMTAIADRYESDWDMVKKGWDMMFYGAADHTFPSAKEAVATLRGSDPSLQDQYFPTFVITDKNHQPVGKINSGDAFVYIDFRADRAIEIAQAFTYNDFPYFDRGTNNNSRPDVLFVGMTEYNSDTHVPELQLVPPVEIHDPLNQVLGRAGLSQLAVSETVKFGHITYYFNGNSYDRAEKEDHLKLDSSTLPFDTRPWMASAEITDAVLDNLEKYDFVRINYPGGDMVGHFAEIEPTIAAMEAIDISLARLAKRVDELGGMMLITADHGNAEELLDSAGHPKTSHTTNKVPCIFYDNTDNREKYIPNTFIADPGLSNVAATIALLLGLNDCPKTWREALIKSAT